MRGTDDIQDNLYLNYGTVNDLYHSQCWKRKQANNSPSTGGITYLEWFVCVWRMVLGMKEHDTIECPNCKAKQYWSFYGEIIDDSKKDSSPDQEPPKSIMEQIKESNDPPF